MRFFTRSLRGLFLFALTLGLLALGAAQISSALRERAADKPRPQQAQERVLAVNVVPVKSETIAPMLTSYGEVRATRMLDLRAPVGGQIAELSSDFAEGGQVKAGALLARLDPKDAMTARDKAQAALLDAETDLQEARANILLVRDELAAAETQARLRQQATARQRDLLARGVGTEAAVETAALSEASAQQSVLANKRALAQAEIQIKRAQSTLDKARIDLDKTERDLTELTIRAEFDGVLSDVNGVVGGFVSASQQLARLIDPDSLEVAFRVSTAQYSRLVGPDGTLSQAPVTVSLDVYGLNLDVSATLAREAAAVAEGQSGRLLFAKLDPSAGLRAGDFVTVRLTEPELTDVARLPSTAVGADGAVLMVGADDRLVLARVDVLRRQGDDILISVGDLKGRLIVAKRTPLLGEGIRIRPLDLTPGETAQIPDEPDTIELPDDRRAKLIAFVNANTGMPDEAKTRVLKQLEQPKVRMDLVTRLEGRMGAGG